MRRAELLSNIGQVHRSGCATMLCAVVLSLSGSPAAAQPTGNLPVYTSPIDVTGFRMQITAIAADRDSGRPVEVRVPGMPTDAINSTLMTPLSAQFDGFWNSPEAGGNVSRREASCTGTEGIAANITRRIAASNTPGVTAYDVTCNLATNGSMIVSRDGPTLRFGYLLRDNSVSFATTSPLTCNNQVGGPCPNDPRFRVRFATLIVFELNTRSLCDLSASPTGRVFTQGAYIEGTNVPGNIASFVAAGTFAEAQQSIGRFVDTIPLPIDAALAPLRSGTACAGPASNLVRAGFRTMEYEIVPRERLIALQAMHAGIMAPTLQVPNPDASPDSTPSFTRPQISTSQPSVQAGGVLQLSGQYFPRPTDFSTSLAVTIEHSGYGSVNSQMLNAGVCGGGATEVEWGPAGGPKRMDRLPGDLQGICQAAFRPTGLTPSTAYEFRARDCDLVTCGPISAVASTRTTPAGGNVGAFTVSLSGGTQVGTGSMSPQGTFTVPVTIPPGTPPGQHTLQVVNGNARAEAIIQVIAAGAPASMVMVGLLRNEQGCPNRPISSTQVDDTFQLAGAGFAQGNVSIHLGNATGPSLGNAVVRADGSICQTLRSPSAVGSSTIVAVQNGAVVAQLPVTFVAGSGVR
ncbi:MAG: hypothetical protein ING16_01815 [Roseomonas sp.]|nr:hypothetical protein [Roseomonas sp.]